MGSFILNSKRRFLFIRIRYINNVMSEYPFSQLIIEIFTQARGLFMQLYKHMANKLNEGVDENFLTRTGGATIAIFPCLPAGR